MEIHANQLMCNIILPLRFLAPLQLHCLFYSVFRDVAGKQEL